MCACVCGVRTRNVCVLQGVTAIDWFPYTSIHTGRNQSPQGMTFQQYPTILKSVFPQCTVQTGWQARLWLGGGAACITANLSCHYLPCTQLLNASNTVHDHNRDNCIV